MKIQIKNIYIFLGAAILALSACSNSPMKYRLDNNFVYQCSLELIDEDVPAGEAEKVCTASHRAEMLESGVKERSVAPLRAPASVSVPVAESVPANLPAPIVSGE